MNSFFTKSFVEMTKRYDLGAFGFQTTMRL